MIPRTLVPVDVRPVDATDGAKAPARRLSSTLDLRTLLPRDMPIKQLEDNHSAIPDYVPLDVIVGRKLIDRGWHLDERTSASAPMRRVETSLDERAVVPSIVERPSAEQVQKLETMPPLTADMLDVIEPDVMTTGDVNLLISPKEDRDARWNTASRFVSLMVHVGIILLALSSPEFFKHVPTDAEVSSAKDQLRNIVYIPSDPPKNLAPPGPKMHIAPGVIHKLAPPSIPAPAPSVAPSTPAPTPVQPKNDLPASITPRTPTPAPVQPQTNPSALAPIKPANPTPGKLNLDIPNSSPGKAVQNSIQDALNHGGGTKVYTDDQSYGGGGGGGGGGGHGPGENGGIQMLSDTQGLDWSQYLKRVLDSVRRNWIAILPESARMGDKGIVVIQFKIGRDGTVPNADPRLMRTSGKEPLDRAAMSSIRASSPFEPLPTQYTLPEIELRFIFLYNLPLDYYQ
jgi:TonB family protein